MFFIRIQNTVCLVKTTVHSMCMYLPEDVLLHGEEGEGTDKSTLKPRFELLQTIILSQQKARLMFFLSLAHIKWTLFSDPSDHDISSQKNLT